MSNAIPFNKPFIAGDELANIAHAVTCGNIAADGQFTEQCSRLIQERFQIHRVLMTPSCTAALEMAAMLCGLEPGDEVIMPSFTFVSTANAVARLGAKPVFVDIRPDTLNIDERLIEAAITDRTRAIMPVHYAGVGCAMDRISAIAEKHGLTVIEDAAQGVNAFHGDRALGSIGELGCFSFHETKNYICGEGGALCINSPELVERAEIIRDKGTNRKQFFRGHVDKYTWVDIGSSYACSEISCAFLFAQLEKADAISVRRWEIYETYRHGLNRLESQGLARLPHIPDDCRSNHHMFYILLPDHATRQALIDDLRERSISAVFHFVPLHTSPMGRKYGYNDGDLPVTENLSDRLLRLPFYYEMTAFDQAQVISSVSNFLSRRGVLLPEPFDVPLRRAA